MKPPDEETRARMVLILESPEERVYDLDGENVKEDLATGRWYCYDPSRDPKEEGEL